MEILNETVYDSGDIERFMLWVSETTHAHLKADFERRKQEAAKRNGTFYGRCTVLKALPEKIRLGYYTQKPTKDGDIYWSSCSGGYRKVTRIGIVRPAKLDLCAMEVIARAVADKDQRVLPATVTTCLARRIGQMLYGWAARWIPWKDLVDQAPTVRYGHKVDRKSVKKSKAIAKAESLKSAEAAVRNTQYEIRELQKKLRDANTRLFKAQARLNKLKAKDKQQRMEAING